MIALERHTIAVCDIWTIHLLENYDISTFFVCSKSLVPSSTQFKHHIIMALIAWGIPQGISACHNVCHSAMIINYYGSKASNAIKVNSIVNFLTSNILNKVSFWDCIMFEWMYFKDCTDKMQPYSLAERKDVHFRTGNTGKQMGINTMGAKCYR
jgi:hypothetical protein